jgi:hypothetical protein
MSEPESTRSAGVVARATARSLEGEIPAPRASAADAPAEPAEGSAAQVLEAPARNKRALKLRKASFRGRGLQDGAQGASWEQLREMSYGDRGR